MSTTTLQLDFPASLDPMGPRGLVASLSAIERGAFYSLLLTAWLEDPPCSLVNDDTLLAAIAGMRPEEWAPAKPRLFLAFQPGQDGRVHNPFARKVYDQMALAIQARRDQTQRAREARLRGAGGDPPRPPTTGLQQASNRPATGLSRSVSAQSALTLVLNSAPTPERPLPELKSSAPESAAVDLQQGGAGARAQIRNLRDKARCVRLLRSAHFPWAKASGKDFVPPSLIQSLAEHRNATPMLVAYAIDQTNSIGRKPPEPGSPPHNPFALLIAAIGAQVRHPKPPWEVPVVFALAWARREQEMQSLENQQAQLNALRSGRTRQSHPRSVYPQEIQRDIEAS